VDRRNDCNEEKDKRSEKELPENKET